MGIDKEAFSQGDRHCQNILCQQITKDSRCWKKTIHKK